METILKKLTHNTQLWLFAEGEEVEITGIYVSAVDRGLNTQNGFPVFSTLIEANFVQLREDVSSSLRVTESDKQVRVFFVVSRRRAQVLQNLTSNI